MVSPFRLRSAGVLLAATGMLPFAPEATPPEIARAADEIVRSDATQRESLAITVYNQNFGLVREVRRLRSARREFGRRSSTGTWHRAIQAPKQYT